MCFIPSCRKWKRININILYNIVLDHMLHIPLHVMHVVAGAAKIQKYASKIKVKQVSNSCLGKCCPTFPPIML